MYKPKFRFYIIFEVFVVERLDDIQKDGLGLYTV